MHLEYIKTVQLNIITYRQCKPILEQPSNHHCNFHKLKGAEMAKLFSGTKKPDKIQMIGVRVIKQMQRDPEVQAIEGFDSFLTANLHYPVAMTLSKDPERVVATFIIQLQLNLQIGDDGLVHPVMTMMLFLDGPPDSYGCDRKNRATLCGEARPYSLYILDKSGRSYFDNDPIFKREAKHFKDCKDGQFRITKSCWNPNQKRWYGLVKPKEMKSILELMFTVQTREEEARDEGYPKGEMVVSRARQQI